MQISQLIWSERGGWLQTGPRLDQAQLVLVFAGIDHFSDHRWISDLKALHPDGILLGCSTAGEIAGTEVNDNTIAATAIHFEKTRVEQAVVGLIEQSDSRGAGSRLAELLPRDGLSHVFVLSDGQHVNGSELVRGLADTLPKGVHVTGGLAGDGGRFKETFIVAGEAPLRNSVAAVGLYGDAISVGFGSLGGWAPFGPLRTITRAEGNVLYELDGKAALDLYKNYLGEHAAGLPATGLLFPLQIQREGEGGMLVRTILNIDEATGSLIFAGDMPVGAKAQLMKTNLDSIVDAASQAAAASMQRLPDGCAELALLVSCVGRKLVLKQRIEEEVEAVQSVLGLSPVITGFYSYGEICPSESDASLQLHNQTMTITTLSER